MVPQEFDCRAVTSLHAKFKDPYTPEQVCPDIRVDSKALSSHPLTVLNSDSAKIAWAVL
jgi:hypothetical protein